MFFCGVCLLLLGGLVRIQYEIYPLNIFKLYVSDINSMLHDIDDGDNGHSVRYYYACSSILITNAFVLITQFVPGSVLALVTG